MKLIDIKVTYESYSASSQVTHRSTCFILNFSTYSSIRHSDMRSVFELIRQISRKYYKETLKDYSVDQNTLISCSDCMKSMHS